MITCLSALTTDQIVSLIGDAAIPVTVLFLGVFFARALERLRGQLERSADVLEQRIKTYHEITNDLNHIFQFCTYVGEWKSLNPLEIIEAKRRVDRVVFGRIPFLEDGVLKAYAEFMEACFSTKGGRGTSIKVRANVDRFRELDQWEESWAELMLTKADLVVGDGQGSHRRDIVQPAYSNLLAAFGASIAGLAAPDATTIQSLLRN